MSVHDVCVDQYANWRGGQALDITISCAGCKTPGIPHSFRLSPIEYETQTLPHRAPFIVSAAQDTGRSPRSSRARLPPSFHLALLHR